MSSEKGITTTVTISADVREVIKQVQNEFDCSMGLAIDRLIRKAVAAGLVDQRPALSARAEGSKSRPEAGFPGADQPGPSSLRPPSAARQDLRDNHSEASVAGRPLGQARAPGGKHSHLQRYKEYFDSLAEGLKARGWTIAADPLALLHGVDFVLTNSRDEIILVELTVGEKPTRVEKIARVYAACMDNGAKSGVVFSESGFTQGAIDHAANWGINLFRFTNAEDAVELLDSFH